MRNCEIAEVIVYKGELIPQDEKRIRSYLAVKYGLTLSQDIPYSYLASNGLDAWNTDDNLGYKNDIFGIGRDTETGLDQQISRSVHDDEGPIFSTDTNFQDLNGAHRIIATDSTFVIAGHDGDPLEFSDSFNGSPNTKLARAWRIDKSSNDIGTYYVAIPKSTISINGENPVLVNEVTDSIISPVMDDGTYYYADLSPLGDGNSFTFASDPAIGPGGVITGLGFWYKADNGTDVTTDSSTVTSWLDQTVNRNTLTNVGTPELGLETADQINFNPTIIFDGGSDGFTIPDGAIGAGDDSVSLYSIFVSNDTQKTQSIVNLGPANGGSGANIGLQIGGGLFGANITGSSLSLSKGISDGTPTIATIHTADADADDVRISHNGDAFTAQTIGQVNRNITATGNSIGYVANGSDEFFEGGIAEVIAFNATHTELERKKLESQLAFKYGITLDQTIPTSYVDSDGLDVWNAGDNAGFDHDIFGIGRDDVGVYSQQISRSANDATGPIFSTDTDFTSINGSHREMLNNMSFVVAAHNGEPLAFTDTFKGESNTKLARHWKIDRSFNEVGPFYVAIPNDLLSFPGAMPVLINALSNAVIEPLIDDGEFYYAEITTIVDGEIFTFASNSADAPGFTLTQDDNDTKLSEAGTDEIFVMLDNPPASNVVITVTSDNSAKAAISTNSLVFTPSDWNVAQEVVVTGIDDADKENEISNITFAINAPNSDPLYSTVENQIVEAIVFDNDTPGIEVVESENSTRMYEKEVDTFEVTLLAAPTSDVVITVVSEDASEATVSPSTMTFTPLNWNVPQIVTVHGVDDVTLGNDVTNVILSVDAGRSAPEYAVLFDRAVSVTVIDEEGGGNPGYTIQETGGSTSLSESSTDTFTVRLDAAPVLPVTLNLVSADSSKATVSSESLVFTSANWNIEQEVIVYGQKDIDALDESVPLFISIDQSKSDNAFDVLEQKQITATVTDTDPFGIIISQTEGSTSLAENTHDTVAVRLNAPPTTAVVITVFSDDDAIAQTVPVTLTFTPENWNIPQEVVIKGNEDVNTITDIVSIRFSVDKKLSDDAFDSMLDMALSATVEEVAEVSSIVPVYRFWSDEYKAHFYTRSEVERDIVIEQYDDHIWRYEGVAFHAYVTDAEDRDPVYRFWSELHKSHFYTVSEAEKTEAEIDENWLYEGIDFYAHNRAGVGRNAVYRFWSNEYTAHFYTQSAVERDDTEANDQHWNNYEGVSYYVPRP